MAAPAPPPVLPALREVRLYGVLGRRFGRVFRLAVLTPAEAVRALRAVLPGFERAFVGADGRAQYHVFVGRGAARESIGMEHACDPVGSGEPIRIVPVVEGAKRGALLRILVGVALLYVAPYLGGQIGGALGAGVAAVGSNIGAALILGGVVGILSPQRRAAAEQRADNLPSYGYDAGPVNTTQQGLPVPLAYGRVVTGSAVISAGLATEELVVAAAPAPIPPQTLPPYQPQDPHGGGA